MVPPIRARRRLAVALGVAAVLLFSACSGAAPAATSDASPGASAAAQDPHLPPAPQVTDGADVTAAQKALLAYLTPAAFTAPGPAFDISTVTKPVWFITATSKFPVVPYVNQAFEAAAKAAGVKYNICPGESTTERNALCIQQAIDAGAGSLLFFSQDPSTLAEPLKKARDAGIKVVSGNNALKIGDPPDPNTDGSVSHDYYGAGVMNGTYAVTRFGGATNALCLAIPEFKVTESVCQGFTAAVTKYCPGCKVDTKDIAVAQLADQTNAVVNAELLSNSHLDFVMGSVDDFCGIAAATVKRVGSGDQAVVCGGQNGTVDALSSIRGTGFQVVSAGQNTNWWGWAFFDATARAQVGALGPNAIITAPNTLLTAQTFTYDGKIDYNNTDAAFGVPPTLYQNGFQQLWKKSP